jgi:glutamate 5-kinase
MLENTDPRHIAINTAKQIIVKAGTRLLIDRESIAKLVSGIDKLRNNGHKVLLVSSGAVGMGMELAGVSRRPAELAKKQALAALGQTRLMSIYAEEAAKHGFQVAQLLLTAADLRSRNRYLNVMNCINALWEKNILPIANENDSVSVDELKFGDNDTLAGMLTSVTGADLTILLTTVDGLRDRTPEGELGDRIPTVEKITEKLKNLAGGTDDNNFSIGGMTSKLRAAELATAAGAYLWIADGRKSDIMEQILAAGDTGTLFLPRQHRVSGRKRWVGFFSKVSGSLTVDDGAAIALQQKGKSLLPSGVISVSGNFRRGDTVEIVTLQNTPIARGLVNFDAVQLLSICRKHSDEVVEILGRNVETEAVHRDNLVLLES